MRKSLTGILLVAVLQLFGVSGCGGEVPLDPPAQPTEQAEPNQSVTPQSETNRGIGRDPATELHCHRCEKHKKICCYDAPGSPCFVTNC